MFSLPSRRKVNEVNRKEYLNFNENPNKPTEMVILDSNGEQRMLNVERDIWHSLGCIERGSVNECVSPDGYFENNRYYDMIMMTKLKK